MKFLKLFMILVWTAALVACGGGGGNPGTPSGSPKDYKPTVTVQIFDANNIQVSNVPIAGGGYAKATVRDYAGVPIAGKTVTFSTSSTIVTLASLTALTNSAGEATVGVYPTVGSAGGSGGTLQAQVPDGTAFVTGAVDFSVGTMGTVISPTLSLQVFNSSDLPVTNITFGGGNYVKATFKNAAGVPIPARSVAFALTGLPVAAVVPTSALTNAQGEARVAIAPVSASAVGAATITAQALDVGVTYSGALDFAVSAAAITLGPLTLGSTSLDPGAVTPVSISAQSNGVPAAGVSVALAADCGTISSVVTTDGNGVANATYSAVKADGTSCRGLVTLTASANGSATQRATLTVAAPIANAINFVSATPAQIFVKGSGAVDQATAQFKVLDSTGVAMPNVSVVFSLTINPGGVGLGASGSTGNVTINSDGKGIVTVNIFSGTIPGPVEVKAALQSNPLVFTTTKNLTVASGPPSQNHISLSVETFNIEGWNRDGSSTNLTVRVADRQGNPVPDGTVINFTAEGGQVAPSCATKLDASGHSACTVAFISQNPRPADGRVTILAHAEGLKEYVDLNGNNLYDPGIDTLIDIGDAYRDDNENGQYDAGEFVIPKGGTAACSGVGGAFPARGNTCTGPGVQATTVRQQTVLMFSSSFAQIDLIRGALPVNDTYFAVLVSSRDHPQLPMPAGTTITASSSALGCTVSAVSPAVVPNIGSGTPLSQLASIHSVAVSGCGGATIFVKATTPSGAVTSFAYTIPSVYVPPPADTTAPVFLSPPAIDYVQVLPAAKHARLTVMVNEGGTGYYQAFECLPATTCPSAPSAAALRLSGTSVSLPASSPLSIDPIVGVTTGKTYRVFFVAVDWAGNQTTVTEATYPSTTAGGGFSAP